MILTNHLQTLTYTFVTLLLFSFSSLSAATIFVDGGLTGGNGTSWATAYGDLQSALAVAASGDEIWVKNGVYLPTLIFRYHLA